MRVYSAGDMAEELSPFTAAILRIDAANADDPLRIPDGDGVDAASEVVYSRRMSAWLDRLYPDASEALRLAARAQHIRRWEIPRDRYPMDRAGYYKWRTTLYRFHADTAAQLLRETGYDHATIDRVGSLLRKERLKADPQTQALEDTICLVFLEGYFTDFIARHDDQKVIGILRRTWAKMSPAGHAAALKLPLAGRAADLVARALQG
jgi:hypothetical protein